MQRLWRTDTLTCDGPHKTPDASQPDDESAMIQGLIFVLRPFVGASGAPPSIQLTQYCKETTWQSKRVIIIGAVALGPKVACRLKRLRPDFEVTMVDQGEYISYGGCGIPYYISGDLSDIKELMSTSFHMLRTPEFFEDAKDVRVRTRTRALAIDRQYQQVRVLDLATGREENLPYDHLVLATGSRPRPLPVPGADLPGVMNVASLPAAMAVRERSPRAKWAAPSSSAPAPSAARWPRPSATSGGWKPPWWRLAPQVLPGVLEPGLARMVQDISGIKSIDLHLEESGPGNAGPRPGTITPWR